MNKEKLNNKKNTEDLEIIRHDCAHVLAEAVQTLFPKTELDFYNAHLQGDTKTCNHIIENIEN